MNLRIESIASRPDRAGRYLIKFDNDTTMRLYRQTLEDYALYPGMELTQEQFRELSSAAGQMSAKMRAVRIVSASNVSKKDLQQRLVRKGETEKQAAEAVAWMEDLDLLDDRRTAEQIVDRCIRSGYGKARAKQALYEKQIPRDLWEDALADYPNQRDKILNFLNTRLGNSRDPREHKRAIDALVRRGHSYSDIQHCLRQLSLDTDDFREEL